MLPTPVLSVSGKGFARLRISAWHFSPAPPILYAVRAIVYHKSRVLSRVLRDFSGGKAPGTPGAEPARHLFALPRGRGPSQTPPSLATDSSISPGPPSPWLPALPLYGDVSAVFATNHRVLMQGRMVGFTSTISGLVPWWERHCVTCRYIYLPCPRLRS